MSNALCQSCQGLDFEQLVNTADIPENGVYIAKIGERTAGTRKPTCNLCAFFHQLDPEYTQKFELEVRLVAPIKEVVPYSRYDAVQKTHTMIVPESRAEPFFYVVPKQRMPTELHDNTIRSTVESTGFTLYTDSRGSAASFRLSYVDTAGANWGAIVQRLACCSQQHQACQLKHTSPSRLPYIHLIDCATGKIVRGNLSDTYLALSYVWGPNLAKTTSKDFSLQNMPLTIRDAAKAVLELGRKYLWADRYCINQQDESEKKFMIDNMDLIYESAYATLVAFHGDHDQSGLPGVSIVSREKQPIFDTDKGQLIYSFPGIQSLMENSTWNTRGWTYQEARLSRRCLFFTRYQVYIVCRHSTWSEAVPFDRPEIWATEPLNSQKLDGSLFGQDDHTGFLRDRLEYSKRNLSHGTDQLNAFRGILRRSSFFTLWGVPIVPKESEIDPNTGLALGLLWIKRPYWRKRIHGRNRQRLQSRRRSGYPTWSWTSLDADICQDMPVGWTKYGQYLDGTAVSFPRNEANIQFWCFVNGTTLSLHDVIRTCDSPILPEYSRALLIEGDFIQLQYKPSRGCRLFDEWIDFEQDLSIEDSALASTSAGEDDEKKVEALILIQWEDEQLSMHTIRFVLMVVHWLDHDHAERVGLLTQCDEEFPCDSERNLPRKRKRFILQ